MTPTQAKAAKRRPYVVRTYEPRTGLVRESAFATDEHAIRFMDVVSAHGYRVVGCNIREETP